MREWDGGHFHTVVRRGWSHGGRHILGSWTGHPEISRIWNVPLLNATGEWTLSFLTYFFFLCAAVFLFVRPVTADTLRRPATLDTAGRFADQVEAAVGAAGGRRPELWLGETGSAQVGGQPEVSGCWGA